MNTAFLAPAAALAIWSMIMLFWMAGTRFPAMKKMRASKGSSGMVSKSRAGGRGQDLEGLIPDEVNWKAHNYTHLMEQPTVFYAVVFILALAGAGSFELVLAWAYVVLRVIHSLWQALVNTIPVRLLIFTAGSVILLFLAVRALILTI
ncbi:MAPEG family protein [Aurantiacibacter sediminis]|uniref:MAPEG family protein n=1 Tax=Aurantiacibacter sediminis TaxID=2793064 RepID=A0ABS0N502_9SPHN|nr:MAPEG family protein [Aurantiacibacter sediminis]MBH5322857.1 MAPEG family protein [Aurantiacibacter sediminis]